MTDFFLINRILLFLINIIGIVLAAWVLLADRRARLNRSFFIMTFFILMFINFTYFSDLPSQQLMALFWVKLAYITVTLSLVAIYFFSIFFPREEKRHLIFDRVVLGIGVIFSFTFLFTKLFIKNVEFRTWGTAPVFGPWGIIFFVAIFSLTILIIGKLFRKYFNLSALEKIRIQYFLVGLFIFAGMNITFNIFLAPGYTSFPYYIFGNYSAIFLLGFTAFAIVRQELFGIKVVLTQALVGVIAVLLLWQAVIAPPDWLGFSWKFALFLLFLIFGYFLIQSVIREIQRRAEVQRLYEEVDRLSRAKSEFISIASHQLRTPLTAIKGYISMLIEGTYGKFEERGRKPLENVYQSNERLINLVNDLLHVSRIESGTLKLELEKTSLEKMISSVLDELRIKADEKNIYLKWEKEAGVLLPEINIDPGKMRQVIMNIIDNCIKYTEKGGITVTSQIKRATSKTVQDLIMIEIKDTGEGIEKEEIEHLFESFNRGQAGEKLWTGGSGLGLYVARKFAEMHGGKVWVESEGLGKGSTFHIEIPVK